jgi:dTDP-4-amino-4,6-dideoxygalactose transaminase
MLPHIAPHRTPVFHLYVVRVAARDEVLQALTRAGIGCGVHYPTPVHLQPAYAALDLRAGSFPVAERLAHEALSLPLFPELTSQQIFAVVEELRTAVGAQSAVELVQA